MKFIQKHTVILFFLVILSKAFAQSIIDDLEQNSEFSANIPELVEEKIIKTSLSQKIFLITNENQSFNKGDFISLIISNNLACRALVAKNTNSIAGIKILKIYSLDHYKLLTPGTIVQVLRGDDSYFYSKKQKNNEKGEGSAITEEEDLYNDTTLLEGDADLDENKNRAIKTDNIIAFNLGSLDSMDAEGNPVRYTQFQGLWAYQIEDNIWIETLYGQNSISNYPSPGLHTKLTNFTLRLKYTIKAPLYSFLQPYVGYQLVGADSPNAGEIDPTSTNNPSRAKLNAEIDAVEDLKKKSVVFGVTLLKRLVPGWFFRADVGSDMIAGGFGLEF